MTTTTLERTEGLSVLNQAMAVIKEKIEEKRGVFNIQMEVRNDHDFPFFWHGDIANRNFSSVCCYKSCCNDLVSISLQPKVVTDTDETELARQLERLERENAEVDGDDDAEEMEAKTDD